MSAGEGYFFRITTAKGDGRPANRGPVFTPTIIAATDVKLLSSPLPPPESEFVKKRRDGDSTIYKLHRFLQYAQDRRAQIRAIEDEMDRQLDLLNEEVGEALIPADMRQDCGVKPVMSAQERVIAGLKKDGYTTNLKEDEDITNLKKDD